MLLEIRIKRILRIIKDKNTHDNIYFFQSDVYFNLQCIIQLTIYFTL